MRPSDEQRFLYALASMELWFRDKLSKDYRRLYFEVVTQNGWTINEWEGACLLAMGGETFHTVPLAGVMQRYVERLREEEWQRLAKRQRLAYEEQKQIESAEARQAALQQLEASQAKLAAMWGQEWLEQHKRMMDESNIDEERH